MSSLIEITGSEEVWSTRVICYIHQHHFNSDHFNSDFWALEASSQPSSLELGVRIFNHPETAYLVEIDLQ